MTPLTRDAPATMSTAANPDAVPETGRARLAAQARVWGIWAGIGFVGCGASALAGLGIGWIMAGGAGLGWAFPVIWLSVMLCVAAVAGTCAGLAAEQRRRARQATEPDLARWRRRPSRLRIAATAGAAAVDALPLAVTWWWLLGDGANLAGWAAAGAALYIALLPAVVVGLSYHRGLVLRDLTDGETLAGLVPQTPAGMAEETPPNLSPRTPPSLTDQTPSILTEETPPNSSNGSAEPPWPPPLLPYKP
ncbi:MAG: hypothetical protein Q4D79_06700 [Propionibacteriaceae bacterium]|nr:hypothetical protein [Propionibacteriaceae bacterium]